MQILEEDRKLQHRNAALLITDLIVDGLTYVTSQSVPDGAPAKPVEKLLFAQYQRHLVKRERQCRAQVEELYYYSDLERAESDIDLDLDELFNEENWYLWWIRSHTLHWLV